jgi:hypothetical protein
MKKTNKSASSPAPATVPASSASKLAPKAATPEPKKFGATPPAKAASRSKPLAPPPSRIEAPAPVPPPAVVVPAAPRAPEGQASTIITAKIDVGFGNALYLRGEGPGLSWNSGLLLSNVGADEWTISILGAKHPIVFKFLLNDATWSAGTDFVAKPGSKVTITPEF